jgi:hypothetical protein
MLEKVEKSGKSLLWALLLEIINVPVVVCIGGGTTVIIGCETIIGIGCGMGAGFV